MECFCDYEPPDFYHHYLPKARKAHKCDECGCVIEKGEVYELSKGKWDGEISTFKTCLDCYELREDLKAMPCFCWSHRGLFEDIRNHFDYADFTPGARIFYLRKMANHRCRRGRLARLLAA